MDIETTTKYKKESEFKPFKGTRTHWHSSNGRIIKVEDLAVPHLENILVTLFDTAKQFVPMYQVQEWLSDHCLTFKALREESLKKNVWLAAWNKSFPVVTSRPSNRIILSTQQLSLLEEKIEEIRGLFTNG